MSYFFSDSHEGIKTQIWIALIAYDFYICFPKKKQAETFLTIENMARAGLNTYVCFLSLIKYDEITLKDKDNGIVQLKIFENHKRNVFSTS